MTLLVVLHITKTVSERKAFETTVKSLKCYILLSVVFACTVLLPVLSPQGGEGEGRGTGRWTLVLHVQMAAHTCTSLVALPYSYDKGAGCMIRSIFRL